MFNKTHRLAKTKDVKKVFGRGRGFFNSHLTLKFLPKAATPLPAGTGKMLKNPRFTVVISTKVSKKAVVRNRLKRVIREFIRLRMGKMVLGDYVIILKPQAAKVEESVILEGLDKLLKSSKLLE